MISKQLLLGVSLLLGGGVIFYAINQGQTNSPQAHATIESTTAPKAEVVDNGVARPVVEPLTVSKEEEDRLLVIKQKQREAETLAQEREAKALLVQQEKARQLALAKANTEQFSYQPTTALTVEARPEAVAAAKAEEERARQAKLAKQKEEQLRAEQVKAEKLAKQKQEQAEKIKTDKQKTDKKKADKVEQVKTDRSKDQKTKNDTEAAKGGQHKVVRGDGLIKLSRQYGVSVSAIAEANNMGRNDPLPAGKTIKIPSRSQAARLEREAREREGKKAAAATADKRLNEARQRDHKTDGKARYGVQVSLADNQAKADELAKKYRAAGYKVTTSATTRGVRVLVGSEKSQDAAEALRDKIRNDSRVDGDGAWVKRTQ